MTKPSSFVEPLKRAGKKLELQAQRAAHAEAREAAAIASSRAHPAGNTYQAVLTPTFVLRRNGDTKRQRTTSRPSSSPSESKTLVPHADSEDEEGKGPKTEETTKIRGAAARNHRAKEIREREVQQQREQERADAAGRRKARSERRRGEGKPSPIPSARSRLLRF